MLTMRTRCFACLLASSTLAATTQIIPWSTADAGYGSGAIYGLAIDGTNACLLLALNSRVQFVRIADIAGAQSRTQLMDHAAWMAASGVNNCTPFQGFDLSGSDFVQFADGMSDEIWRINKHTGVPTKYVSKAGIASVTGGGNVSLVAVQCVIPSNGEHLFYDSTSSNILTTTGSNACSVVVSASALLAAFGPGVLPAGGMGFDGVGNLYFGTSTGSLCRYTAGVLTTVLTRADITNLILLSAANFGTMRAGPDGLFYFRNGSGTFGSLLRFSPANPAGTLELIISGDELTNSVAASANVNNMRWHNGLGGGWAWHQFGQNGVYLTPIPEPAALIVSVFGLIWTRRVRTRKMPDAGCQHALRYRASGIRLPALHGNLFATHKP